jgi:hypothetical protein
MEGVVCLRHDPIIPRSANRSRFEQVYSKLDSPAEPNANAHSGFRPLISPSPSVALRVCSGHPFAYELLTPSVVALVRSRGGFHAGFKHCSQLIVFRARPRLACRARSGHFFPFNPISTGRRMGIFRPRRLNSMPSLSDFFSIASTEVRRIAAASSIVTEVAAI